MLCWDATLQINAIKNSEGMKICLARLFCTIFIVLVASTISWVEHSTVSFSRKKEIGQKMAGPLLRRFSNGQTSAGILEKD